MELAGKKMLVTGAGGFIGSHLVERLVELGAKTRAFVKYNSRNDRGLLELLSGSIQEKIEIFAGDLRDIETVHRAVEGAEIVFHLGALIAIPYSYLSPRDVVTTNIIGTLNVLTACREHGVGKLVHTSSSEVYGTAQYVPIDEKHPLQGQSPYAASKIGADKLAESFYRSYNLPVATIRPFNTYGPRQSARAVIPTIITQALTKDKIQLGNLHPRRDLTYVADTVEAFIKMAGSPKTIGKVINIGSGQDISIAELAEKILTIMGTKKKIVSDSPRIRPAASEVDRLLADIKSAQSLIGWKPQTPLDEGITKTIEWISQSLDFYKPLIYNI